MKNLLLLVILGSAAAWMAPAHAGKCGGGHGGGHTGESFADRKLLQRYADAPVAGSERASAAPFTAVTASAITASARCSVAASPASGDPSSVATLDVKGLVAPACTQQP